MDARRPHYTRCGQRYGWCMMLAILEDDSQQHGPMQLLFTTNEETGMDGAFAIKEGQVSGDYLLNLDTEVEHDFTVSCAGGCHVHVNIPLLRENNQPGYDAGLSFTVTGLKRWPLRHRNQRTTS